MLNDNLFNNTKILVLIHYIVEQFRCRGKVGYFYFLYTFSAFTNIRLCKKTIFSINKFFKLFIIQLCGIYYLSAHKIFKFFVKNIFFVKNMRIPLVVKHCNKLFIFHSRQISFSLLSFHIIKFKYIVIVVARTIF